MGSDETVWVEVECRTSDYRIRTFRGRTSRSNVEAIVNGNEGPFLHLAECYWYNDADDDSGTGKPIGTFQRLGHDEYSNFTGEMHIRSNTILSIAYLKRGFDGEPKADP